MENENNEIYNDDDDCLVSKNLSVEESSRWTCVHGKCPTMGKKGEIELVNCSMCQIKKEKRKKLMKKFFTGAVVIAATASAFYAFKGFKQLKSYTELTPTQLRDVEFPVVDEIPDQVKNILSNTKTKIFGSYALKQFTGYKSLNPEDIDLMTDVKTENEFDEICSSVMKAWGGTIPDIDGGKQNVKSNSKMKKFVFDTDKGKKVEMIFDPLNCQNKLYDLGIPNIKFDYDENGKKMFTVSESVCPFIMTSKGLVTPNQKNENNPLIISDMAIISKYSNRGFNFVRTWENFHFNRNQEKMKRLKNNNF